MGFQLVGPGLMCDFKGQPLLSDKYQSHLPPQPPAPHAANAGFRFPTTLSGSQVPHDGKYLIK